MSDRDDIDLRRWAERAFDDEPPGASVVEDLARGRAALSRRRRWTAGASSIAVAAAAFAIAIVPWQGVVPSGDGETSPVSDGPSNRAADRALLDQCQQVADGMFVRAEVQKGREPTAPPKLVLSDWSVVDRIDDEWGTTAILLSPDETEWAECTVGLAAGFRLEKVQTPAQVPQGYVQQADRTYVWKGGDTVSSADQCCGRDLYFLATRLPDGVGSLRMRLYDGTTVEARVTDGFALLRTLGPDAEDYTGRGPGSQTKPPIVLTYRAPDGEVLSEYNAEFVPPDDECEGC